MLHRLNNKQVRGEGFTVSVSGIHQVQYAESDKVALVEIEGASGPNNGVSWTIYSNSLTGWQPPHEHTELSPPKREQILANVGKCLALLNMPHEIV